MRMRQTVMTLTCALVLLGCPADESNPTQDVAATTDTAAQDGGGTEDGATPDSAAGDATHDDAGPGDAPDASPLSVTLAPPEVTLGPGGTQAFTATFLGGPPEPLEWLVDGGGGAVVGGVEPTGTVTKEGVYTAPLSIDALTQVTVTARVEARPDVAGSATVLFDAAGPSLSIATPSPTVPVGLTFAFKAGSTGIDPTKLTWTLETSPPRNDIGAMDPTTGVYRAPDLLPNPPVALIEAVVSLPGSSLQARTPLLIQSLRFEPPDVELLDPGATATFDVIEELSDGTGGSLLGQARLALTLDNPLPACASLQGAEVTALDPTGVAMVFAADTTTGAQVGLRVHNRGRPSLFVDEDTLVHGIPGFDLPLSVELRIARTAIADGGPDISDDPRLVFEALDAQGDVLDGGAPAAPDALVAWIDLTGPRVVYGGHPGTASFRVSLPDLGIEATFQVELLTTWLAAFGRGPGTKYLLYEIGQVPAGGTAPWTGSDVSLVTSYLSGDVQDLVVLLWGTVPDDARWSLLSADDLGTGRSVVWEVLEGHGHFLGPELTETHAFFAAPDQARGVYEDGPLAGQAWARRALGTDTLDRYLQAVYGDSTSWKGMRGAFTRFVATRPGHVVIEARLEGSDLQPVRWEFDCKAPLLKPSLFTGYPSSVPPLHNSTAELRLTQVRDPSVPQNGSAAAYLWVPPHRVEIKRPSGELVAPEQMLVYVRPDIQDRAHFVMNEPGTWTARLVYDAEGVDFPTDWYSFDVMSLTDYTADAPSFGVLIMVDQSDDLFIPGQTLVTIQALGPNGPVNTTIEYDDQDKPIIKGPSLVQYPDFGKLGSSGLPAGEAQAPTLEGRWWPVGPFLFGPELYGSGTIDTTVGPLYPAVGSSTLQFVLELDPSSVWNPKALPPARPPISSPLGLGVFFDPPSLVPPPPGCVTPVAGGHETVVHVTGSASLGAVIGGLTTASITVVDRPWMTVSAVEPVGATQLDVRLSVDLGAAGAQAFGADSHTLRITADNGIYEAPFRLYRTWLSGWQPDLAAAEQTADDPAVGLPLNARFRGPSGLYREGVMPAQVHVEGHAPGVSLTLGTRNADGERRTAMTRDDMGSGEDTVIAHAPLGDIPLQMQAVASAGAPASYEVLVYGDLTDQATAGELGAPDGLPDAVSPAPGAEELWIECDGRETAALPFTAFAYRAVPVGDLRAPATALGAPTPAGAATYAAQSTFAGTPTEGDALEVRVDVDNAAAGQVSVLGLAHLKDRDGRAHPFDGAHLTTTEHDALPDWLKGTGSAATWGVELDALCFDPDIELFPTNDVSPNDAALFPPDHVPPLGALGFLDDEGGTSSGLVGTTGEGWGRFWVLAETPGSRWPGLDCAHPYTGSRDAIAAEDDDLEDVALFADAQGIVDLASAWVAALAEAFDRPGGVTAGVQVSGARFGYVWTTLPEASPGVPILQADLVGTLIVGEEPRFRPVQPGEPGWHPDGTCTPGVDDDLVVTARRYTGGSGEARLIGLRIAVDTIVAALAAAAYALLAPAAVATTPFWYATGQGGLALITSYVSELNALSSAESLVVGKLVGKAGGKVGSRVATRAALWMTRIFGANLGTKAVSNSWALGFADEATSVLSTALSEGIKRTSLTDGDSVSATAEATVAETLSIHVPDECIEEGDTGARVAMIHSARTVSVDSRADFRAEPPGDLLPTPAQGGQTRAYIQRCVALAGSPWLLLSPGAPLGDSAGLQIPGIIEAPPSLADFKIVVRGQEGEVWGIARSATAVASRSNPAGTARVRLRADGALFFAAYGMEVEAIRR